jgi:hypothetical protein
MAPWRSQPARQAFPPPGPAVKLGLAAWRWAAPQAGLALRLTGLVDWPGHARLRKSGHQLRQSEHPVGLPGAQVRPPVRRSAMRPAPPPVPSPAAAAAVQLAAAEQLAAAGRRIPAAADGLARRMPDWPARRAVPRPARSRAGPRPSATLSRWPGPGWPRTRPSAPGSRAARTASSARPGSPPATRRVPMGRLGQHARQAARRRGVPARGGTRRTLTQTRLTVPPGRRGVRCRRIPARAGRPRIQAGIRLAVAGRVGPTRGGWPRIQARRGLAARPGRLVQTLRGWAWIGRASTARAVTCRARAGLTAAPGWRAARRLVRTRAAVLGAPPGPRRAPISRAVPTVGWTRWTPVPTSPAV